MAYMRCNFYSDVLRMNCEMQVIYPEQAKTMIGVKSNEGREQLPQVLYLLHGSSDDDTIWLRRTSIERYVSNKNLVIVMPNAHLSFYSDIKGGFSYWKYLTEELPAKVASFFRVSSKREDTFAAGLSMGGYGAIKMVLARPDQYYAGASLSGALYLDDRFTEGEMGKVLNYIHGSYDAYKNTISDLLFTLGRISKLQEADRPKLYACCGTEDFLYEDNQIFRNKCKELGVALTYEEEKGEHEWGYWDMKIQDVLKWLPLRE